jgi:predicted PurR-regulated permease PerM
VGRLMWLGILLFVIWFLYSILGILAPFLVAFLLAYVLNPIVSSLEKRGIPRWLSALVSVLLMIGIVVSVLLFVLPLAVQQFQGLLNGLGQIVADVGDLLKSGTVFEVLDKYGIPVDKAREMITNQLSPRLEDILKALLEAVLGFVTSVSGLVMQLVNAIIIPFLAFYMLMDFPAIVHRFLMMTPRSQRERVGRIGNLTDRVLGKYFRGAVIVALIQGCLAGIGLWLIGVNYPLVLGMMTGILDFIPYVGLVTSLIVASTVAVFSGGNILAKVVAVVVLYLSQKLLEGTVLGPKIVGKQVGLHPVLLILCLLVFGYFVGFIGLLIAVPTSALIIAGVKEWELTRKEREA